MKRGALGVLPFVLFGCQSATVAPQHTLTSVPPPAPTPGWTKPALGNIGFTMMLPEGWEAIVLGEKRPKNTAGPKNFSEAVLGGWGDNDTGFMATGEGDPSGKGNAIYFMTAIRSLKNHGTKVDQDIADLAYSLKQMGVAIKDPKRTTVNLPVGKAEKVQYRATGFLFEETTENYFVVDGDYHYQFTFSSMGSEDISLPGDAVMTTFRTDWMSDRKSD